MSSDAERERKPFDLDKYLQNFRDPESQKIMLTPDEAKIIYTKHYSEIDESGISTKTDWFTRPTAQIALKTISVSDPKEKHDYEETRRLIEEKKKEVKRQKPLHPEF
jgi:hypothetical protein